MEIKAEPSLTGKGGQTTELQAYQLSQICAWRPESPRVSGVGRWWARQDSNL